MKKHFRSWLMLVAVAIAPCAGCAVSVEADFPEVEVIQHAVSVPGAPPEGGQNTLIVSFGFTPPRFELPRAAYSKVQVLQISLAAKSGPTDLSFIRSLRIILGGDGETEGNAVEPVEIASYDQAKLESTAGSVLVMPRDPPAEIARVWRSDNAVLTIQFAGDLPLSVWTADVSIHYAAKLAPEP